MKKITIKDLLDAGVHFGRVPQRSPRNDGVSKVYRLLGKFAKSKSSFSIPPATNAFLLDEEAQNKTLENPPKIDFGRRFM